MSFSRIRSVKPDLWLDEELAECSIPARFLFVSLFGQADRDGRLEGRGRAIKARSFPYDDIDVEALLDELARDRKTPEGGSRVGFIIRYEVSGRPFIQITSWFHQAIPHNERKAKTAPTLPPPPPDVYAQDQDRRWCYLSQVETSLNVQECAGTYKNVQERPGTVGEGEGEGEGGEGRRRETAAAAPDPIDPPSPGASPFKEAVKALQVLDPDHWIFQLSTAMSNKSAAIFTVWTEMGENDKADWIRDAASLAEERGKGNSRRAAFMAGVIASCLQSARTPAQELKGRTYATRSDSGGGSAPTQYTGLTADSWNA